MSPFLFKTMKKELLRLSTYPEIPFLVDISIRSFNSDIEVGAKEKSGPPDYDSYEFHKQMYDESRLYSFYIEDDLIGGALLWANKEEIYIGRIFIDPIYFKKGYGIKLMKEIERLYPKATCKLDTPIWNIRTNSFYKKLGYIEVSRNNFDVSYIKSKKR